MRAENYNYNKGGTLVMKDDTKNGDAQSPRGEHIEKLGSLIDGVKIAMLTHDG